MTGHQLTRIRERLGLTRKAFAQELGISRNSLKEYEDSPKVKRLVALAAEALAYKGRQST